MFEKLTAMLEAEADKLAHKNQESWHKILLQEAGKILVSDLDKRKDANRARRKRVRKRQSK